MSILGCIDPFAQNTDSLANVDDGSCLYDTNIDTIDNSLIDDVSSSPITVHANDSILYLRNIDALPIISDSPYLVALTLDGLIIGSSSLADDDLIGGQQSVAV